MGGKTVASNISNLVSGMSGGAESAAVTKMQSPKILLYARILMLVELTRLAGLQFIFATSGAFPAYFALPFGAGDTLIGLTAAITVWALGKPGSRRYALALAWNFLGLVDGLFGLTVSSFGGILGTISAALGPGLLILPVDLAIHSVAIAVLLTGRVSRYMTR